MINYVKIIYLFSNFGIILFKQKNTSQFCIQFLIRGLQTNQPQAVTGLNQIRITILIK